MFSTFELFGKTIGTYQVLALIGIFAAGVYACKKAKKHGLDDNDMIELLLIAAFAGLVGAHLLYGLVNYDNTIKGFQNIFKVKSIEEFFNIAIFMFGGAVYYGGLLGGLAASLWFAKRKKLAIGAFYDIAAPAISLFHVFGRIGCFLGGCCYGIESNIGFTYANSLVASANGVCRLPIQLIESGFNLLLFFGLNSLLNKGILKGKIIYVYLLCYAIGRYILEFFRGDIERGFLLGQSVSQWISIFIICAVIGYLISEKNRKKL